MPSNPFKLPGSDLLRIGDSFLPGGRNSDKHAPPPKPKDTGLGQGGGGGRRKPAEAPPSSDLEAMDMTTEPAPEEQKPAQPEAKLSDAAWTNPETLFLEESEVTCKRTSPPGKEHLTRVEAKLFAKRAKGPELITKVDGNADESGVVISIFSSQSGKGHIVRLQSVEDGGLVVDDPFGKLNNFKQREDGGSGYTGTANTRDTTSNKGENNLWKWKDIGDTVIKYADAFYPKE